MPDNRHQAPLSDRKRLDALLREAFDRLDGTAPEEPGRDRPNLKLLRGGKAGAAIILGLLALPARAREHWIAASAATAVAATAALGVTYAVTRPPERPPSIQAEQPDGLPVVPEVQVESPRTTSATPSTAPADSGAQQAPGRITPPAAAGAAPTSPAAAVPTPTDIGPWPTSPPPPASATPTPTVEQTPVTEGPDPGADTSTPTPTLEPTPSPDPDAGDETPSAPEQSPGAGLCVRLPGLRVCVVLPLGPRDSTVD